MQTHNSQMCLYSLGENICLSILRSYMLMHKIFPNICVNESHLHRFDYYYYMLYVVITVHTEIYICQLIASIFYCLQFIATSHSFNCLAIFQNNLTNTLQLRLHSESPRFRFLHRKYFRCKQFVALCKC